MFSRVATSVAGATLIAVTIALSGCSASSRLPGTYINKDDSNGAFMVQIDDVHDHDVHGTISYVGTDAAGKMLSTRTPLSGTIDGKGLNLSIENGMASGMVTGTIVPAGLQLTLLGDGQSMRLLFKRADAADFDSIVSDLRTKAAQTRQDNATVAAAAAHAQQLAGVQQQIDSTAEYLFRDAQSAASKAQQIENVIEGYPRFSARDMQLRAAATRISPRADDDGRLDDINSRISGNRDRVADAHSDAQGSLSDVESSSARDVSRANQFLAQCQADRNLICTRLASALSAYMAGTNNLRAVVAREGAAFDRERSRF